MAIRKATKANGMPDKSTTQEAMLMAGMPPMK